VAGSYFPRGGEEVVSINFILDGNNASIVFTLNEMRNHSSRISIAENFYNKYLTNATTLISSGRESSCDRTCATERIAEHISWEIDKRENILGIGALSIKKKWAHGENLLYHRGAVNMAPAIEKFGEWEESSIQLLSGLLSDLESSSSSQHQGIIFDVGANTGLFTFALSSIFPRYEFHTFEPQRIVHNIICANVALRGAELNIISHNVGVGDKEQVLKVPIVTNTGNSPHGNRARFAQISLREGYHDQDGNFSTYQVQGITLSSLTFPVTTTAVKIPCPTLVKIDVEGYEKKVLKGMTRMFENKCTPLLYLEDHGGWKSAYRILDVLSKYNYHNCYHHIFDYVRAHQNWIGNKHQGKLWEKKDYSSNMLCVADDHATKLKKYPNSSLQKAIEKKSIVRVDSDTMNGKRKVCTMNITQCGGDKKLPGVD